MEVTNVFLFTFVILLATTTRVSATATPKIAIIGAGIGGSSCAYYINKFLPNAEITIFEANDRIGGRIMSVDIEGVTVEVGAAAWASANQYITELVKELKLPVYATQSDLSSIEHLNTHYQQEFPSLEIGIWDGNQLLDAGKVVLSNLKSTAITTANVAEFLVKLKLNYFERADGGPFMNITEYLTYGKLKGYVNTSTFNFLTERSVEQELMKYFIEPLMIHIYDQELDIHPFAALTSLTSLLTTAHSVIGGNCKLPEALVNASTANLNLNSRVHTISKEDNHYSIAFTRDGKRDETVTADAVVLAVPIEWTGITFKKFNPNPASSQPHRDWKYWYVHFVVAESVSSNYFKQPEQWIAPDNIFTTANASLPWASIQLYQELPDGNIYKLFCTQNLTGHMGEYFINVRSIYTHHWLYTFPNFNPVTDPADFQDIWLDDGLFNINTIESVASAMEVPVINARNVAMMIAQAIHKDYEYETYDDCI